jgi:hypothetical protein
VSPGDSEAGPLRRDRPTTASRLDKTLDADDTPQDRAAQQVRGALVVVVEMDSGKWRRRCFLTVKAAEQAVARAEAKGYAATVVLCRLEPTAGWSA